MLVTGCNHSQPFQSRESPQGPRSTTPPVRLTYNLGQNLAAAWKPDGSGVLYVYQQQDRTDQDRCLGLLPAVGGTRIASKCYPGDVMQDSTDAFDAVAAGPDGRLAWIEGHAGVADAGPSRRELRIGSLSATDRGTLVLGFPYLSSTGQLHSVGTHLGWLGADALVYVGAAVLYPTCKERQLPDGCKTDTLVAGREIVQVDLTSSPPTIQVIPGTAAASSVWPAVDGSAICYTLAGDSSVYRRTLASGVIEVRSELAAQGVVRDVACTDSALTAVVGGKLSFTPSPTLGPVQYDSGGFLHYLDLRNGHDSILDLPGYLMRHPVLSPGGGSVVTEVYPDRGTQSADLWLFETP
jgi:hypothetical protein